MLRSNVDFPLPEDPTTAIDSPASSVNDTPSRTRRSPNRTQSPSTRSIWFTFLTAVVPRTAGHRRERVGTAGTDLREYLGSGHDGVGNGRPEAKLVREACTAAAVRAPVGCDELTIIGRVLHREHLAGHVRPRRCAASVCPKRRVTHPDTQGHHYPDADGNGRSPLAPTVHRAVGVLFCIVRLQSTLTGRAVLDGPPRRARTINSRWNRQRPTGTAARVWPKPAHTEAARGSAPPARPSSGHPDHAPRCEPMTSLS